MNHSTGMLVSNRRLFLQGYPPCIEDDFLFQVIDSPNKGQVWLDQVLTNKADYSDHTLMEFTMMRRVRPLILGEQTFSYLRNLWMGVPRTLLSGKKEMNRNYSSLNTFRVKEIFIPICKKWDKDGVRPSRLSKGLLTWSPHSEGSQVVMCVQTHTEDSRQQQGHGKLFLFFWLH